MKKITLVAATDNVPIKSVQEIIVMIQIKQ